MARKRLPLGMRTLDPEERVPLVDHLAELRRQMPGAPEIKLMVFAALLLADESRELRGIAKAAESARATATKAPAAMAQSQALRSAREPTRKAAWTTSAVTAGLMP